MHAMLSNDYKRKLCCMAAGAPAAFQLENTTVRPPIIDVFHVRSSSTARHTKCNSRQTRRGSASPQSAHTSSCVLVSASWKTAVGARTGTHSAWDASQTGARGTVCRRSFYRFWIRRLSIVRAGKYWRNRSTPVRSVAWSGLFGAIQKPTPPCRFRTVPTVNRNLYINRLV